MVIYILVKFVTCDYIPLMPTVSSTLCISPEKGVSCKTPGLLTCIIVKRFTKH